MKHYNLLAGWRKLVPAAADVVGDGRRPLDDDGRPVRPDQRDDGRPDLRTLGRLVRRDLPDNGPVMGAPAPFFDHIACATAAGTPPAALRLGERANDRRRLLERDRPRERRHVLPSAGSSGYRRHRPSCPTRSGTSAGSKLVAAGLATVGSVLVITTSFAQSSANCRAYAEDYSLRYSAPWATLNFNVGGGAPALVRWPPIGPAPFNSPPSSTAPTHAAWAVDGRKEIHSSRAPSKCGCTSVDSAECYGHIEASAKMKLNRYPLWRRRRSLGKRWTKATNNLQSNRAVAAPVKVKTAEPIGRGPIVARCSRSGQAGFDVSV
jgi:hypothetical protein